MISSDLSLSVQASREVSGLSLANVKGAVAQLRLPRLSLHGKSVVAWLLRPQPKSQNVATAHGLGR